MRSFKVSDLLGGCYVRNPKLGNTVELVQINRIIQSEFLLNLGDAIRAAGNGVGHVMRAVDFAWSVGEIFAAHVVDFLDLGASGFDVF